MANFNNALSKNLFDSLLPSFGQPRAHVPVWDNGQKMFICDEYEAASGNRYYRGVRFCDQLVVVEKVGLYHSCTYIDSIELYAFNVDRLELVQKQDYTKVFRDEEFIRAETERMTKDYFLGAVKLLGKSVAMEQVETNVKQVVDKCYKSILDEDYSKCLMKILPVIEQQDQQ